MGFKMASVRNSIILMCISLVLIALWFWLPFELLNKATNQLFSLILVWFFALIVFLITLMSKQIWLIIRSLMMLLSGIVLVFYPALLVLSMVAGGPISTYIEENKIDYNNTEIVTYNVAVGATVGSWMEIRREKRVWSLLRISTLLYSIGEYDNITTGLNGDSLVVVHSNKVNKIYVKGNGLIWTLFDGIGF